MTLEEKQNPLDQEPLSHEERMAAFKALGFYILMASEYSDAKEVASGLNGKHRVLSQFDSFVRKISDQIWTEGQGILAVRVAGDLESLYRKRTKENLETVNAEIIDLAKKYREDISESQLMDLIAPLGGATLEARGPKEAAAFRTKFIFPNASSGKESIRKYQPRVKELKKMAEHSCMFRGLDDPYIQSLLLFMEMEKFSVRESSEIFQFFQEKGFISDFSPPKMGTKTHIFGPTVEGSTVEAP